MISDLFTLVNWAFASSLLILLVLLLRRTSLRKKLSRTLCYALWLPVLLRLLLPVQMISLPLYPHISPSGIVGETTTEIDPTNIPQDSAPSAVNRPTDTERVPTNGVPAMTSPTSPVGEETPERVTDALSRSDLMLLVWRGGAITLAAAIAASNLLFTAKLRRRRVPLAGVSCALPVYTVEGHGSPCLAGVFRPAVYLSSDDARNAQRLRHIVAHEESHFRGGDHIWSVLRAAALCLHWYDPLVWYAVVVSKRDAELACDERTLRRIGGAERAAYGETLLSLTMAKPSARDLLSCSTAMVGGKRTLRERIEGIAHSRQTRAAAAFFVIVVLIFALLLAFGKQREVGEYERFIERVEAAECIAYHPPAYSGTYYPALTDPDLVAAAKELVLTLERADERDVPAGEPNILLTSGISIDGEYRFSLLNVDGATLLYRHNDEAAGYQVSDFILIGKYTDDLITSRLRGLAGRQKGSANTGEPTALRFLTELQTSELTSAVLTVGKTASTLEDAQRDEIFFSLRDIAREAFCREVTGEDTLKKYPSYDFSVTFELASGTRITLSPMSEEKGSVFMSLVSETENRRFVLDSAASLYSSLLYAAGVGDVQGELRDEIYEAASVSGSETDLEAVARSIGEQIAAAWLAVPEETVWKPTDAKLASVNVFDIYYGENGAGRNFCAGMSWKLKFDSRFSANYWEAGSGLGEPDTDGYYSYGLECTFAVRADENWHITGIGTGGASVNCGIDLWHSDTVLDCASIVKVFLLTAGKTHDYLIPSRFCDLPASERTKLGTVLDGYTVTQASDFLRAVSDHLAQYPTYHDLTAETLYAELTDKYKDFALILAAEPLWTGEAGVGRFALYDYGKHEWALLYETGDVREIAATYHCDISDPNDSITAFVMDDLLGFPGVAVQSDAVGAHKSYDYYARTDYGVQYIGYSFGFYDDPAECTFSVDFDGDGHSELITDNIYGADGADRITVFRWNGAASEVGSPDWSKAGVNLSGIGAMNYQESYDAARSVVTLSYRRGEEIKTAELPLAPENFMWLVIDEL